MTSVVVIPSNAERRLECTVHRSARSRSASPPLGPRRYPRRRSCRPGARTCGPLISPPMPKSALATPPLPKLRSGEPSTSKRAATNVGAVSRQPTPRSSVGLDRRRGTRHRSRGRCERRRRRRSSDRSRPARRTPAMRRTATPRSRVRAMPVRRPASDACACLLPSRRRTVPQLGLTCQRRNEVRGRTARHRRPRVSGGRAERDDRTWSRGAPR